MTSPTVPGATVPVTRPTFPTSSSSATPRRSYPRFEPLPQAVSRPERDPRERLDALRRIERQPPAAPDRREHEPRLHERERLADAAARAAAEGEVAVPRPRRFDLGEPAVR